jgi:hypothetical protein
MTLKYIKNNENQNILKNDLLKYTSVEKYLIIIVIN